MGRDSPVTMERSREPAPWTAWGGGRRGRVTFDLGHARSEVDGSVLHPGDGAEGFVDSVSVCRMAHPMRGEGRS